MVLFYYTEQAARWPRRQANAADFEGQGQMNGNSEGREIETGGNQGAQGGRQTRRRRIPLFAGSYGLPRPLPCRCRCASVSVGRLGEGDD